MIMKSPKNSESSNWWMTATPPEQVMAVTGVIGVILLFFGPLCIVPLGLLQGVVTTLTCTRLESKLFDCEISTNLLGFEWTQTKLEHQELLVATVDRLVSEPNPADPRRGLSATMVSNYCVSLTTQQGSDCLTMSELWEHQAMHDFADRINQFIGSPREASLVYEYNLGRVWQFFVGGPILGVGGYGLLHLVGKWLLKKEGKPKRS